MSESTMVYSFKAINNSKIAITKNRRIANKIRKYIYKTSVKKNISEKRRYSVTILFIKNFFSDVPNFYLTHICNIQLPFLILLSEEEHYIFFDKIGNIAGEPTVRDSSLEIFINKVQFQYAMQLLKTDKDYPKKNKRGEKLVLIEDQISISILREIALENSPFNTLIF